jgi:hypothetical protein
LLCLTWQVPWDKRLDKLDLMAVHSFPFLNFQPSHYPSNTQTTNKASGSSAIGFLKVLPRRDIPRGMANDTHGSSSKFANIQVLGM